MNEQRQRVMLVDDYPDALETWRLYLGLSGFDVVTAVDGRAAVDLAHASHPDIIVMDLELPVLSGIDAAQELRATDDTADIPMIAATGYSHFNGMDHDRLSAFDLVVVKPCDPAQLLLQIRRLLARAQGLTGPDERDGAAPLTRTSNGHSTAHNG
jgi:DNA-binding response OmpR family regulator